MTSRRVPVRLISRRASCVSSADRARSTVTEVFTTRCQDSKGHFRRSTPPGRGGDVTVSLLELESPMRRIVSCPRLQSLPRCSPFLQRAAPHPTWSSARYSPAAAIRTRRTRTTSWSSSTGGTGTVDLSTWSIQYATGSGTTWQVTPLSGSVPAGGHYLIQLASAAAIGASLPTADATGTSNLAVSGGKVALVHSTTGLTCGASAGSCSADHVGRRPDRVRLGHRLRRRGARTGHQQHDRGRPCRRWMYRKPTRTQGLLRCGADAAQLAAVAAPCSGGPPPTGVSQNAGVDIDIQPVPSIALERPSISFGMLRPARRRRRSRSASPSRVITRPATRSLSIARPLSRPTSRLVSRQRRRAAARSAAA